MACDTEKETQLLEIITKVRESLLDDYAQNKELYDETDIEKVKNDNWYVTRFILRKKKDPKASFEMLRAALRWRKELGIPQMKDTDFPQEFYKIGGIFPYVKDLQGNGMVYLRIKMHKRISEMELIVKKFVLYIINKVDMEVDGRGIAIVFDCEGAGISNADLDMVSFLINALNNYYPRGLSYILVYELPWILNAIWKIIKNLIPAEHRKLIKFATKKDICEYIASENLPAYLGGACPIDYRSVPKGCQSAEDYARGQGLNDNQVEHVMKVYRPFLAEAEESSIKVS